MTILLSDQRIDALMIACLPNEERPVSELKVVEGPVSTFGFIPAALEEHRAEIEALIAELPNEFFSGPGGGGGYTFLGLHTDRHGNQWTGLHSVMQALMCLAIAIDKAKYCMPREFWKELPGGLPYVVFER